MAALADQVQPMVTMILEDLCCRLGKSDNPVCSCGLAVGDPPALSSCCQCFPQNPAEPIMQGSAWVRVGDIFPVNPFPIALDTVMPLPCNLRQLAVTVTLGIWRCAPTLSDTGEYPSEEEITAAVEIQLQDRALMFQAAECSLAAGGYQYLIQAWSPIEPLGGCMGSQLVVLVGVSDCFDCPDCVETGNEEIDMFGPDQPTANT